MRIYAEAVHNEDLRSPVNAVDPEKDHQQALHQARCTGP
ncbi:hypothetical protein J2S56_000127 [Corynebacterium lowii]|nr:hypothetical protein [Corynebacterium lowii]